MSDSGQPRSIGVGENSQLPAHFLRGSNREPCGDIENKRLFQFGTTPALIMAWTQWGVRQGIQKGLPMFSIATVRETATLFAGAFISALLLVSAATSLPIA